MQYIGAEKTLSLSGQKCAVTREDSEGSSSLAAPENQNHFRKRDGIFTSYETLISETFLMAQAMLEEIPEHVGGNVTVG
jgi:hypothetical protein